MMKIRSIPGSAIAATSLILLLTSADAFAFRCGQKIVIKNMHEIQVRKACGAPTTERQLGFAVRNVYVPSQRRSSSGVRVERFPDYGPFLEEVIITEYIYNFGPRKLIRRLVFEGGVLVKIETLGYGYREKKSK